MRKFLLFGLDTMGPLMAAVKPIPGGSAAHPSAADLSAYQWRFAKLVGGVSAGDTALLEGENVLNVAGAGDSVYGVISMPALKAGDYTTVVRVGQAKVKTGAAIKGGDKLKSGAGGVAVVAAAGEKYYAVAVEGGISGSIIPVNMEAGTA